MINSHRLRIRLDGRADAAELDIDEAALDHELVYRDNLAPETLVWFDGHWITLRDYPHPRWLDEMVRRAVDAIQRSQAVEVERFARKILHFAAGGDSNEVVRIAKFLLGHLRLCAGMYREAVDLLEASIRGPSCVLAASHNNLGVAWAYLRNPLAALKHLELATAESPDLFPAELSLRNLAATLAEERAPQLPGRPAWAQLAQEASGRLRRVSAGQIHGMLNPNRSFPSYHFVHIFPRDSYFPPLSSQLTRTNHEELAARRLLEESHQAVADRRYELALELARTAGRRCPSLNEPANAVAALAQHQHAEAQALRKATTYADDLKSFFSALDGMTVETLDAPREPLARLASHDGAQEIWEQLYRSRVEQLLLDEFSASTDECQQWRLLDMAAIYAEPARAATYRRAVKLRRAGTSLRSFRQAVLAGDEDAADSAHRKAAAILGAAPDDGAKILQDLRQQRTDDAFLLSDESFSTAALLRRQIEATELDEAWNTVSRLLWSDPASRENLELRGRLRAARQRDQAREALATHDWRTSTEKLRAAIQQDPRRQHTLMLAFALELLFHEAEAGDENQGTSKPDVSGFSQPQLVAMFDQGMSAIRGFMAGDTARCRAGCDQVLAVFPASWVMQHMRESLPAESNPTNAAERR